MVKIRLTRQGQGHNKFFKIVVINEQVKRNGQALDMVGYWQPAKKIEVIDIKKIKTWIAKGAVLSNTVLELVKGKLD